MQQEPKPEVPRYLRFLTAMVLGSAVVVAPLVLSACDDEGGPPIDARPPDADEVSVDGPLPPPDLPRLA